MEHAVPEEFWVDKSKCKYTDADGKVQNPTLQACAEGISAVKAIAIAQSQGQKIYTINKDNRDTALPKLTIGGAVGDEIRNAINAGKEVTFHESAINAHGWSGHGYIILDPETGVGAHLIDGGGNGAVLEYVKNNSINLMIIAMFLSIAGGAFKGWFSGILIAISIVISILLLYNSYLAALEEAECEKARDCMLPVLVAGAIIEIALGALGMITSGTAGIVLAILPVMIGMSLFSAATPVCNMRCKNPVPDDI
jgi:hypothetical protein